MFLKYKGSNSTDTFLKYKSSNFTADFKIIFKLSTVSQSADIKSTCNNKTRTEEKEVVPSFDDALKLLVIIPHSVRA